MHEGVQQQQQQQQQQHCVPWPSLTWDAVDLAVHDWKRRERSVWAHIMTT